MKCPMRIGRKVYDGGEDCDPKCALRIVDVDEARAYCAMVVSAEETMMQRGIEVETNHVPLEWDLDNERWMERK